MQQYTRTTMVALLMTIGLTCLITPAIGIAGVKDYGDSCNILSSGVQIFDTLTGGDRNYAGACDIEKGLICPFGTCTCLPDQQFRKNIFESIVGGGRCVGSGASSVSFLSAAAVFIVAIPILIFFRV